MKKLFSSSSHLDEASKEKSQEKPKIELTDEIFGQASSRTAGHRWATLVLSESDRTNGSSKTLQDTSHKPAPYVMHLKANLSWTKETLDGVFKAETESVPKLIDDVMLPTVACIDEVIKTSEGTKTDQLHIATLLIEIGKSFIPYIPVDPDFKATAAQKVQYKPKSDFERIAYELRGEYSDPQHLMGRLLDASAQHEDSEERDFPGIRNQLIDKVLELLAALFRSIAIDAEQAKSQVLQENLRACKTMLEAFRTCKKLGHVTHETGDQLRPVFEKVVRMVKNAPTSTGYRTDQYEQLTTLFNFIRKVARDCPAASEFMSIISLLVDRVIEGMDISEEIEAIRPVINNLHEASPKPSPMVPAAKGKKKKLPSLSESELDTNHKVIGKQVVLLRQASMLFAQTATLKPDNPVFRAFSGLRTAILDRISSGLMVSQRHTIECEQLILQAKALPTGASQEAASLAQKFSALTETIMNDATVS